MENSTSYNLQSVTKRSLGSSLFECVTIDSQNREAHELSAITPSQLVVIQAGAICICLQGSGNFVINNTSYHVGKGSMITILPNTIVGNIDSTDDFVGYIVGVNTNYLAVMQMNDMVKSYVNIMNNPVLALTEEQVNKIIELGEMLKRKREDSEHPFCQEICKSLLSVLCYEIYAIYRQNIRFDLQPRTRQGALCQEFLALVEKYAVEHRDMGFYADKLCITPKYLSVVIKKISGYSPAEWLNRKVILYAKTLLTNSDMTVQQISAELHFPNPSFFGQYFKRHEGITPKQYRNQNRKS